MPLGLATAQDSQRTRYVGGCVDCAPRQIDILPGLIKIYVSATHILCTRAQHSDPTHYPTAPTQ